MSINYGICEMITDIPMELSLEIFKFIPTKHLINVILVKPFYEVFKYYRMKLHEVVRDVNENKNINEIRLEYVNNYLTLENDFKVENHLNNFRNLVLLNNESYREYFSRRLHLESDMCKNLKEFKERFHSRIGTISRRIIEGMFKFTSSKSYKFVVAGSSVLNCFVSEKKDFNDIDVFLIYGKDFEHSYFGLSSHQEEIKDFITKELKHLISPKKYMLFLNRSYLSICIENEEEEEENEPKQLPYIQINFRCCYTIEELLTFFDLDCCRFAYDGNQVYTTPQGVRFLNIKTNYIEETHKKICFTNRLEKYLRRGFDTVYTDSNLYYHPLLLYFSKNELSKLFQRRSYSYNKVKIRRAKFSKKRSSCEGIEYDQIRDKRYNRTYKTPKFPMTYDSLKKRIQQNRIFHDSHDCIFLYDRYSNFIFDSFDAFSGEVDEWGVPKDREKMFHRGMIVFDYYFSLCSRFGGGNTYIRCKTLEMLNFSNCKKCRKYFDLSSKDHFCEVWFEEGKVL